MNAQLQKEAENWARRLEQKAADAPPFPFSVHVSQKEREDARSLAFLIRQLLAERRA